MGIHGICVSPSPFKCMDPSKNNGPQQPTCYCGCHTGRPCHMSIGFWSHPSFPLISPLHDEVVFNKLHVTSAPKTYMNVGVLTTFSLFCIAFTVIEFSVAQSTFVLTIPTVAMLRSLPPLHNCRWPPLDSIEPYVRSLHNVYPFYLDF